MSRDLYTRLFVDIGVDEEALGEMVCEALGAKASKVDYVVSFTSFDASHNPMRDIDSGDPDDFMNFPFFTDTHSASMVRLENRSKKRSLEKRNRVIRGLSGDSRLALAVHCSRA